MSTIWLCKCHHNRPQPQCQNMFRWTRPVEVLHFFYLFPVRGLLMQLLTRNMESRSVPSGIVWWSLWAKHDSLFMITKPAPSYTARESNNTSVVPLNNHLQVTLYWCSGIGGQNQYGILINILFRSWVLYIISWFDFLIDPSKYSEIMDFWFEWAANHSHEN